MDQSRFIEQLGQVGVSETGRIFHEYLRGAVREMIVDVMAAEVDELCGLKYHPDRDAEHQRAGSAEGMVLWQGRRENVKRPRVRRKRENGSSDEVRLKSYESAGRREELRDMVIQRCLVHKEHNLCGYLSKRDWGELGRLFKRLRDVQGKKAAEEVYAELERFLSGKNATALESFYEAGEELIALHSLEVPSTLHTSLLSTNLIENSFRNTCRKLGHVTRFRAETDQASRWLVFALMEVEKGFRRIRGWRDLPSLAEALKHPSAPSRSTQASTPLRPPASTPSPPESKPVDARKKT